MLPLKDINHSHSNRLICLDPLEFYQSSVHITLPPSFVLSANFATFDKKLLSKSLGIKSGEKPIA